MQKKSADEKIDKALRRSAKKLPKRPDCGQFSEEETAAYFDGVLPEAARERLFRRLAESESLRREALFEARVRQDSQARPIRMPAGLKQALMARQGEGGGALANIVRLVFQTGKQALGLLQHGTEGMRPLEPIAVRGEKAKPTYQVVLGECDVEVATDRQKDDRYEVWLKVGEEKVAGRHCQWQLWSEDALVESQPASQGEALFSDLPAGRYRCVFLLSGAERGTIELSFEDAGNEA